MNKERISVIKNYIYENIKILEDRKAELEDKKISRKLIKEEVECLEKHLLYLVLTGTTEQVEDFRSDMREVENMLQSYLAKLSQTANKFDNEIYQVYTDMIIII